MLMLSREVGQGVVIRTPEGRVIRVVLGDIKSHGKARLGFEADKDVVIDRDEVDHAKERERANGGQHG